jgi:hypothetical protein
MMQRFIKNSSIMVFPYLNFSSKDLLAISNFLSRIALSPSLTASSQHIKSLKLLYVYISRFIVNISRRQVVLQLPLVRRKLRWAIFLTVARASVTWWRRVLLEPKGIFEKMVKKQGIVLLFAALKGQFALGRPQPAPQTPSPAAGSCSPLELVIGMTPNNCEMENNY